MLLGLEAESEDVRPLDEGLAAELEAVVGLEDRVVGELGEGKRRNGEVERPEPDGEQPERCADRRTDAGSDEELVRRGRVELCDRERADAGEGQRGEVEIAAVPRQQGHRQHDRSVHEGEGELPGPRVGQARRDEYGGEDEHHGIGTCAHPAGHGHRDDASDLPDAQRSPRHRDEGDEEEEGRQSDFEAVFAAGFDIGSHRSHGVADSSGSNPAARRHGNVINTNVAGNGYCQGKLKFVYTPCRPIIAYGF